MAIGYHINEVTLMMNWQGDDCWLRRWMQMIIETILIEYHGKTGQWDIDKPYVNIVSSEIYHYIACHPFWYFMG
jgi:hypothetical protein